jgi:hypothetical protein
VIKEFKGDGIIEEKKDRITILDDDALTKIAQLA